MKNLNERIFMRIFKVTWTIALLVSLLFSQEYYSQVTAGSVKAIRFQGLVLKTDTAKTSPEYSIRTLSNIQVSVSGIDSTNIYVTLITGGRRYLNTEQTWSGRVDTLLIDTTTIATTIDTITKNGVYIYSSYQGTGMKFVSTKADNGVRVILNGSNF